MYFLVSLRVPIIIVNFSANGERVKTIASQRKERGRQKGGKAEVSLW